MKDYTYACIKRWREKNRDKFKEQQKRYNDKSNGWLKIAREFRKICLENTS